MYLLHVIDIFACVRGKPRRQPCQRRGLRRGRCWNHPLDHRQAASSACCRESAHEPVVQPQGCVSLLHTCSRVLDQESATSNIVQTHAVYKDCIADKAKVWSITLSAATPGSYPAASVRAWLPWEAEAEAAGEEAASAATHFPSALRERLIDLASWRLAPTLPERLRRSLPARSTKVRVAETGGAGAHRCSTRSLTIT